MDTDSLARGTGPEPTAYDQMRHGSMKLRTVKLGLPTFVFKGMDTFPGTCLKCVFDEGAHSCGR